MLDICYVGVGIWNIGQFDSRPAWPLAAPQPGALVGWDLGLGTWLGLFKLQTSDYCLNADIDVLELKLTDR
jgi:hypothetical protein